MNDTSHLNSEQFMRLVAHGGSADYFSGNYDFRTLHSGLAIHGGHFTAVRDWQCSRLNPPYISFIILLEGGLDFAIDREHCRLNATGGKTILIASGRETVFRRYLHRGETTAKITLKGIEGWLAHSDYNRLLPALYAETVRVWPLNAAIAARARECLRAEADGFSATLLREAAVLQLLAALWQDLTAHYPLHDAAAIPPAPDDTFRARLDRAFAGGAHQVGELAAALHISERTLQRRLRDSCSITVSEWLRHKHMQYALHALTTGTASIGEIAWRCGYRHSSSFIQAFRQYYGCTPARVRDDAGRNLTAAPSPVAHTPRAAG